ncbi:MAG: hypothetical protein JNK05_07375 [Myxococcales bacterium]|nr:hypothetical protein [Myxococcales bacterium]
MYMPTFATWISLASIVMLTACGAAVSPRSDGGGASDVQGASCELPGGGRCPAGTVCPAGDGCNTCQCPVGGGVAGCTLIGCVRDAGPGPGACNSRTPCSDDQECVYTVGACGVDGRCSPLTDCAQNEMFCGCDGSSFRGCRNRPTRPAASMSPCTGTADGGALANCDLLGAPALCEIEPGPCPAGLVRTVVGTCFGECVPPSRCAPFACTRGACPDRFRCDSSANRCVAN